MSIYHFYVNFLSFCFLYNFLFQFTTLTLIYLFFLQFTNSMCELKICHFISHLISIYKFYVIFLRFCFVYNFLFLFTTLTLIYRFFHQFINLKCGLQNFVSFHTKCQFTSFISFF